MTSIVLQETKDASYEPSERELAEYARWIGMDPDNNNYRALKWIAREGLMSALPDGWKACRSPVGELFFFDFNTGASSWDHPNDEHYRKLAQRESAKLVHSGCGSDCDTAVQGCESSGTDCGTDTVQSLTKLDTPPSTPIRRVAKGQSSSFGLDTPSRLNNTLAEMAHVSEKCHLDIERELDRIVASSPGAKSNGSSSSSATDIKRTTGYSSDLSAQANRSPFANDDSSPQLDPASAETGSNSADTLAQLESARVALRRQLLLNHILEKELSSTRETLRRERLVKNTSYSCISCPDGSQSSGQSDSNCEQQIGAMLESQPVQVNNRAADTTVQQHATATWTQEKCGTDTERKLAEIAATRDTNILAENRAPTLSGLDTAKTTNRERDTTALDAAESAILGLASQLAGSTAHASMLDAELDMAWERDCHHQSTAYDATEAANKARNMEGCLHRQLLLSHELELEVSRLRATERAARQSACDALAARRRIEGARRNEIAELNESARAARLAECVAEEHKEALLAAQDEIASLRSQLQLQAKDSRSLERVATADARKLRMQVEHLESERQKQAALADKLQADLKEAQATIQSLQQALVRMGRATQDTANSYDKEAIHIQADSISDITSEKLDLASIVEAVVHLRRSRDEARAEVTATQRQLSASLRAQAFSQQTIEKLRTLNVTATE